MGAPTYLLSNECVRVDSAAGRLAVVAVRPPPDVHAERAVTFSTRSYRIRYREILGLILYRYRYRIEPDPKHAAAESCWVAVLGRGLR